MRSTANRVHSRFPLPLVQLKLFFSLAFRATQQELRRSDLSPSLPSVPLPPHGTRSQKSPHVAAGDAPSPASPRQPGSAWRGEGWLAGKKSFAGEVGGASPRGRQTGNSEGEAPSGATGLTESEAAGTALQHLPLSAGLCGALGARRSAQQASSEVIPAGRPITGVAQPEPSFWSQP